MEHEKHIKDERGRIRICVKLSINEWKQDWSYSVRVSVIPPKKRAEIWNQTIATPEEILQAKLEFWELIKPTE